MKANINDLEVGTYYDKYSDNYGVNAIFIKIDNLVLYFSYRTLVGVKVEDYKIACQNIWGNTTGKHINLLKEKGFSQYDRDRFLSHVQSIMLNVGFNGEGEDFISNKNRSG